MKGVITLWQPFITMMYPGELYRNQFHETMVAGITSDGNGNAVKGMVTINGQNLS